MIKDIILYDYVTHKVEYTGLTANSVQKTLKPNNATTTKIQLSNVQNYINTISIYKHAIFILDNQNNIISGGLILTPPEIDKTNNTADFLLESITSLLKEQPFLGNKKTGTNGAATRILSLLKTNLDRYDNNIYKQISTNPIFRQATVTFEDNKIQYQQGIDLDLFEILVNLFQASDIAFSDDWEIVDNKITPTINVYSRISPNTNSNIRAEKGINLIDYENITTNDNYANYVLVIGADDTATNNTDANTQHPPLNIYKHQPNNTRIPRCKIISDKRLKTNNKCSIRADKYFEKININQSISSITLIDHAWAKIKDLSIYEIIPVHINSQLFNCRIDEITIDHNKNTAVLKLLTKEQQ